MWPSTPGATLNRWHGSFQLRACVVVTLGSPWQRVGRPGCCSPAAPRMPCRVSLCTREQGPVLLSQAHVSGLGPAGCHVFENGVGEETTLRWWELWVPLLTSIAYIHWKTGRSVNYIPHSLGAGLLPRGLQAGGAQGPGYHTAAGGSRGGSGGASSYPRVTSVLKLCPLAPRRVVQDSVLAVPGVHKDPAVQGHPAAAAGPGEGELGPAPPALHRPPRSLGR